MPETPRTWTLKHLDDGEEVEVIEKAPVDAERERMLDLLKEAFGFLGWNEAEQELQERIDALLRVHGRPLRYPHPDSIPKLSQDIFHKENESFTLLRKYGHLPKGKTMNINDKVEHKNGSIGTIIVISKDNQFYEIHWDDDVENENEVWSKETLEKEIKFIL